MRPPPTTLPPAPLAILTAADAAYAGCLAQLLRNLERRGLARAHRTLVCDLGLGAARRAALAARFSWAEFRDFDFSAQPPHVALARRTYAWKPLLLAEVAREVRGPVLWLDSASLVRATLDEVRATLQAQGLYLLRGQTALRFRCDPAVSTALGASPSLLDEREFVAGVIGVDPRVAAIRDLLESWRRCALDPALLRPRSAHHLPEQAVLSVLVLQAVAAGRLALSAGDVDISSPAPVRWVSTRHKVPDWLPAWAGPALHFVQRTEKAGDRLLHRLRHFKATRVNGLHRWPKEHFQIHLCPAGQTATRPVPAPRWSYYADPFLWREAGQDWLFAEEFRYLENSARLVAMPLDRDLRSGTPQPLELAGAVATHRSFPFLFAAGSQVYLVPETSALRAVDLFVCTAFPARWRWVRRLLDGIDAADTLLLPHAGRWWLFTSVRPHDAAPRHLEIHHTDDLLAGCWTPHPVNAEALFAAEPFSSGRCAGSWVRAPDGSWLRPVQSSRTYYGQGVRYRRIDLLTPTAFQESEFAGADPPATLARRVSPHHVAHAGDLVAFDVRTRVSYGQHVPIWRHWAVRPDARPSS
jgi:hypothetical protein